MIQGRTILCFASGYDAPPTSKHHVMHLLAERNVVLWVSYHASRTPSASASDAAWIIRKLARVAEGLRTVGPNLYELTPLVLPLPGRSLARTMNRRLIGLQIARALRRIRRGPLDVWSFAPDVAYLLDDLKPQRTVYYCVDDFAHFTGYDAEQILADERRLARRADLVVVTSRALLESKSHLNPHTLLVPHGVDYSHFAQAVQTPPPVPAELAALPRPRLGFFGLIRDWVDLDLLAGLARQQPGWQIVLLGDSTVDLQPYLNLPNLHFLGRKPYASLPAYCAGFDAGLIPFRISDLTRAVNPIKLREYLSAGLPVVSTPLPDVPADGEMVFTGERLPEVVSACQAALAVPPEVRRARSEAMAGETWSAKLAQIEQALADSPCRPVAGRMDPGHE